MMTMMRSFHFKLTYKERHSFSSLSPQLSTCLLSLKYQEASLHIHTEKILLQQLEHRMSHTCVCRAFLSTDVWLVCSTSYLISNVEQQGVCLSAAGVKPEQPSCFLVWRFEERHAVTCPIIIIRHLWLGDPGKNGNSIIFSLLSQQHIYVNIVIFLKSHLIWGCCVSMFTACL